MLCMKNMYIILSATTNTMGKCIRFFTHSTYNHVSISFDDDLNDLVSFARYYHDMPFYGGFIHENIERYRNANIMLYKIPIDEKTYQVIQSYIADLEMHADDYLYHTINALLCPFHKSIYIPHAHTCISFTESVLQLTGLPLSHFYEINQIKTALLPYLIYEGSINHFYLKSNPEYLKSFPVKERIHLTYRQQRKLIQRLKTRT